MFVRKKQIEMDGVTITVAPLTFVQTETFFQEQREAFGLDADGKPIEGKVSDIAKVRNLWHKLVADGINNASPEGKISVERIRAEMDNLLIDRLRKEIAEMSGIMMSEAGQATGGEEAS